MVAARRLMEAINDDRLPVRARRFRDRVFLLLLFENAAVRVRQDRRVVHQQARGAQRTIRCLVKAMGEIARAFGKKTIAEQVEDPEKRWPCSPIYGIDYAQGYHVGRPVPDR
jgi:EAL domain-containing protein (putative c-di-GMP-specific phosphodiesterase class I)